MPARHPVRPVEATLPERVLGEAGARIPSTPEAAAGTTVPEEVALSVVLTQRAPASAAEAASVRLPAPTRDASVEARPPAGTTAATPEALMTAPPSGAVELSVERTRPSRPEPASRTAVRKEFEHQQEGAPVGKPPAANRHDGPAEAPREALGSVSAGVTAPPSPPAHAAPGPPAPPGAPATPQTRQTLADPPANSPADPPPASAGPAQRIEFRLAGEQAEPVTVQVAERRGRIELAVRTPDRDLAQSIGERANEIVRRIEAAGFRTRHWTGPAAAAPPAEAARRQPAEPAAFSHFPAGGFESRSGEERRERRRREADLFDAVGERPPAGWAGKEFTE